MPADGGVAPAPVTPHPGRTTQLMYACSQGDLKSVQRILHDQPTSLKHLDRTFRTPLHYCAGGTITTPVTPSLPPLPPAARLSHCADVILMAAPDLVHSRDQDGFTPLHLAVIAGNVQLVQFLIANGADVKAKDAELHSVVHWATVCGETAALQAVLAAGAEISTPDVHGGFPLHYAAQMCGSEKPELGLQVLHILLSTPGVTVTVTDNDGRQPLLWASSAGSARAVLALVRAGAGVESSDKDGLTALHCAASRGHTDTLDTLLTLCGAQTDVIDSNGCTALHYSVTLGHADATALLLSHSADPNLQDRKGRSPAHCGCAKGQLETVRQLHTSGANLWLRTARGDLPLHEAAASGRRQLVRWLLDQRPSQVNSRNNDGRGLLHLAALNDNADMCKILLDSGASVNPLLRTSKNIFMTPLDCALQRGFRSTAKFLQLHGGVPASRLNTLRISSELAVSSGSHLHIRDDITVLGGSSSETEIEESQRAKENRGRRKTVRRKLSHRHERRKSYSGSDQEVDCKVRAKSSSKSAHEKLPKKSDVKSDGKHFRKKKEVEESVSETETSPEIRKEKYTKSKTDSDRRKLPSDAELIKQSSELLKEAQSKEESSKKDLQSDHERKRSKKAQKDDSSYEISDTEKSRKITSDRERRKNKKQIKEELKEDVQKKKQKSNNEEQDISDHEQLEPGEPSTEEKTKKKSSEVEAKKEKKSNKKSDISDSDTRNKISDNERRKKKSADKKKEKEVQEKLPEEKELDEQNTQKELNQKSTPNELSSQAVQEDVTPKEPKTNLPKSEELQKQDSIKLELQKSESKGEETKSSIEDTTSSPSKDTTIIPQASEDTKTLEEDLEQPSESIQPDQVSLQSKLSEGSPSKTIVVEAAVHHPPKGISAEDISQELSIVAEEHKETAEETKEEIDASEEAKKLEEDKKIIEEGTEENKLKGEEQKVAEKTVSPSENEEKKSLEVVDEAINGEVNVEANVEASEVKEITEESKQIDTSEQQIETKVNDGTQDSQDDKLIEEPSKESAIVADGDAATPATAAAADAATAADVATAAAAVATAAAAVATAAEASNGAEESTTVDTKESSETLDTTTTISTTTTTEVEEQKKDDTDNSKKELNIDLSLKKFEESAEQQHEVSDIDHKTEETTKENETIDDTKQKKYRKKVRISKSHDKTQETSSKDTKKDGVKPEEDAESTSTSRETSSTDSETEKSTKKSKKSDGKNEEHKSFKILHDDVAFEVLKESTAKEHRKVRKTSKKRAKEAERLNESATSSPEMLESARTRSKSVPRQKDLNQITLPSLVEKRPESNLSAPNLSSVYSDNEQKSGSNSEVDDLLSSASRKKRIKRRSKLRVGSKSAGSDYESSNLIDSGFEPSPRSSRIPKRKVMSERGVNMTSVTQQIQSNIRKYHMERKIFQHLLDLKRLQIRSGQANESVLVKRAIDTYHNSVAASVGAGRYLKKDFTYRSFEQFLYQSLRMLQKTPPGPDHMRGLPDTSDNPLLCTQSTHRCLHATHAYTGIPCAAYLPKMNHHTMPKIGFTPRSTSSFLPQITSKGKSVTLELCHGNDKQVISLPADRLDHNKRYYVTFTVKGQDGPSPVDQENTTSHRHAKSV